MTEANLPVTYYANKTRLFKLFIGGLIFVAIGVWLLYAPYIYGQDNHIDNITRALVFSAKTKIIAYLGIIFFGCCSIIILSGLLRGMKLFAVSREGITPKKGNLITWNEIAEIKVVNQTMPNGRTYKWIGIFLKNKDSYYANLNALKRNLARFSESSIGTPVVLDCTNAKLDPEKLTAELNSYFEEYKTN